MKPGWFSEVDRSWTLFLDRDGVINERLPGDYVKTPDEFHFLEGAKEAIQRLSGLFGRVVIVTNQQGIGKGVMKAAQLYAVHQKMLREVGAAGGRIDAIYFCPELAADDPDCRKPNTGMAVQAQRDFPEIDFARSVIAGDSTSDMEFGERLGMKTVMIGHREEGLAYGSLLQFARDISVLTD